MKIDQCDTPALLLDIGAAERNINKMVEFFRGRKASLRPHIKVHKSPFLAHKQLNAGARGITCAKISEAEVMVNSGINDILIANEIVGEDKIRRLVKLSKICQIAVIVDDLENTRLLSSIASEENSTIRVLIELNLSGAMDGILDRCGVSSSLEVIRLVREISKLSNIEFAGLMGYEGSLRRFHYLDSRKIAVEKALTLLVEMRDKIVDGGQSVDVVSCGGTMSYDIAARFPGVTEVQAGSYIFMDTTFRNAGIFDFETALTVLTRVISKPKPEKIIVDAGYKAISADHGFPEVKEHGELVMLSLNAEHGHISCRQKESTKTMPNLGDKLELLPSHADTTVCLHDNYVVTRSGEVERNLEISCRGKLQ